MAPLLNYTLENAFTYYVSGQLTTNGITGYNYTQGTALNERLLPVIYCNCNRMAEEFPFSALYRATIVFDVITQADMTGAYNLNALALGAIRDAMSDLYNVQTVLNMPATGADTRPYPDLTVQGLYEDGIEVGQNLANDSVRCIGGTLQYQVFCQAAPYPFLTSNV
jgi:hypothetical protein